MRIGIKNLSGIVERKTLTPEQESGLRSCWTAGQDPETELTQEALEDLRHQVMDGWHVPLTLSELMAGGCPLCQGTEVNQKTSPATRCLCTYVAQKWAQSIQDTVPSMVGRAIPIRPNLLGISASVQLRLPSMDEALAYAAAHAAKVWDACKRGTSTVSYQTASVKVATGSEILQVYRSTDRAVQDEDGARSKVSYEGSVMEAYGSCDVLYLLLDRAVDGRDKVAGAIDELISIRMLKNRTTFLWLGAGVKKPSAFTRGAITPQPTGDGTRVAYPGRLPQSAVVETPIVDHYGIDEL